MEMVAILVTAGTIAGLIQYFVILKGLKLPGDDENNFQNLSNTKESPGTGQLIWVWVKTHWQFIGYIIIGVAGALLTPVINEIVSGDLVGLQQFKVYAACAGEEDCEAPNVWHKLILLGYGIVFGYSGVRIITSIGSMVIGKISSQQQEQQKQIDTLNRRLKTLTNNKKITTDSLSVLDKTSTDSYGQKEAPVKQDPKLMKTASDLCNDGLAAKTYESSQVLDGTEDLVSCKKNPNTKPWKKWAAAKSLYKLWNQIDELAPSRNTKYDGMIGDKAHQNRKSDHNPWVWNDEKQKGIVTALDITHDSDGNCDCGVLADTLHKYKDKRIKYVIWNGQIMNSASINGAHPWAWRPYKGDNPHDKHIHISVKCDAESYDDDSDWMIHVKKDHPV